MQNYKSKDKPYPANIFSRECLLESAFLKPTTVTNSFLIRKHICKLFFYQININMNSSATIVESIKKRNMYSIEKLSDTVRKMGERLNHSK